MHFWTVSNNPVELTMRKSKRIYIYIYIFLFYKLREDCKIQSPKIFQLEIVSLRLFEKKKIITVNKFPGSLFFLFFLEALIPESGLELRRLKICTLDFFLC